MTDDVPEEWKKKDEKHIKGYNFGELSERVQRKNEHVLYPPYREIVWPNKIEIRPAEDSRTPIWFVEFKHKTDTDARTFYYRNEEEKKAKKRVIKLMRKIYDMKQGYSLIVKKVSNDSYAEIEEKMEKKETNFLMI